MAKLKKLLVILLVGSVKFGAAQAKPERPQVLEAKSFVLCGKRIKLEVADSSEARQIGLMHRQGIPAGTGMLFVFPDAEIRQFWMRNVPFDIDIAYFDGKGKLLNALTMLGTSLVENDEQLPRYPSAAPAQYAVEVEKGFYQKIKALKNCKLRPLPSAQH